MGHVAPKAQGRLGVLEQITAARCRYVAYVTRPNLNLGVHVLPVERLVLAEVIDLVPIRPERIPRSIDTSRVTPAAR
jgi:hypothetical protein